MTFSSNIGKTLIAALTFSVYASCSIFSKSAALCDFLSPQYMLNVCGVVGALGMYALLWQKLLTWLPLNKAFLLKSSTIIIILMISHFYYGEAITLCNVLGAFFITIGIITLSCTK